MWCFTRSSFVSIVATDDPDLLLVRGRLRGDIERLWPRATVEVSQPWRDYRYRASIPRDEVAAGLAAEVCQIQYSNYKDSITDKRRAYFYGWIWRTAADMQDSLEGRDGSLNGR